MDVDHGHCYHIYHVLWKQSFQSMTGHLSYTGCVLLDVQRPSHWCQLDIDRTCERLVKFLTRESFAIGVTGLGSVGGKLVDSWGFENLRGGELEIPCGFHVVIPPGFHMNSTKIAHWVYILDQTAAFSAILESFHCCIQQIYSFTFIYFAHAP